MHKIPDPVNWRGSSGSASFGILLSRKKVFCSLAQICHCLHRIAEAQEDVEKLYVNLELGRL